MSKKKSGNMKTLEPLNDILIGSTDTETTNIIGYPLRGFVYNVEIETQYNTIYLTVDDIDDPDVKEIITQPWVVHVKYWRVVGDNVKDNGFKRLVRRKEM